MEFHSKGGEKNRQRHSDNGQKGDLRNVGRELGEQQQNQDVPKINRDLVGSALRIPRGVFPPRLLQREGSLMGSTQGAAVYTSSDTHSWGAFSDRPNYAFLSCPSGWFCPAHPDRPDCGLRLLPSAVLPSFQLEECVWLAGFIPCWWEITRDLDLRDWAGVSRWENTTFRD